MNKKVKITLLVLTTLIVIWGFSWKFRDNGNGSVTLLSIQHDFDSSKNNPYSEKYQQTLLAELTGKEKLPKFEDFPMKVFSDNKNITVDINSDPIAREYRTAIRYGVEKGEINFAGKYLIIEWGCGSGCQGGAMVDANTGHVYPLPGPMVSGFEARKDSSLLIQNPLNMYGNWREWYRMCYWEWAGNKFKLIGVYGVDFDKKKIVEAENDDGFCSIK